MSAAPVASMFQQLLAVFLVLALLGAALWLLRRKGMAKLNVGFTRRSSAVRRLEVVDRIALTAHHSLHLVRVENRMILIGVSPSGCTQMKSCADEAFTKEENANG
jgi:flagellar biogenesis protein FliO